jgi:hypothetical protein
MAEFNSAARRSTGGNAEREKTANATHRHAALESRAGGEANYARVLNLRAAGPQPVQRAERPNRTGLPDGIKARAEALSGLSLDDVKVHFNSARPARLDAHAYAQGNEIHVAPGQDRHLPHEAWHVVQQKQGRVRPLIQVNGLRVNHDPVLEHEADRMATAPYNLPFDAAARPASGSSTDVVQPVLKIIRAAISALPAIPKFSQLRQSFAPAAARVWNQFPSIFSPSRSAAPVPQRPFPGVLPGSMRKAIPFPPYYELNALFANFQISGEFKVVPGGDSEVKIGYIEKTPIKSNFVNLFNSIEKGAQLEASKRVYVTFEKCVAQVAQYTRTCAQKTGFTLTGSEMEDEGETLVFYKVVAAPAAAPPTAEASPPGSQSGE